MAATNSSPIELHLSRLHWPVTALGYGRRIGIWFQGCSIRCPGCCSRDTWDVPSGQAMPLDAVLDWIAGRPSAEIDGFTISGGEPFDQPEALAALIAALRERHGAGRERDLLVYSGYSWSALRRRHAALLDNLDVLVSGPYRDGRPGAPLRGSGNQKLHRLSELGRRRYGSGALAEAGPPRLQADYDGRTLWMIGVPRPGDLERLAERLAASGIRLDQVSWRA
jgi:anaerobic ribonucleoside-triphosphate reductase activating protein